jgi:hypothetical protein
MSTETPRETFMIPLIRCACDCAHVWDVAFVPWVFRLESGFKCAKCKRWCKTVQLFRDSEEAPSIDSVRNEYQQR